MNGALANTMKWSKFRCMAMGHTGCWSSLMFTLRISPTVSFTFSFPLMCFPKSAFDIANQELSLHCSPHLRLQCLFKVLKMTFLYLDSIFDAFF